MEFFLDSMDSDDERFTLLMMASGTYEAFEPIDNYLHHDDDEEDGELEEGQVVETQPAFTSPAPSSRRPPVAQSPPRASARRAPVAPPAPAPPLAPPPPTLCRFFVLGKCRFGSRCTYSHALPTAASAENDDAAMATAAATVDCPFFQRGRCKYADYCRLRHAPATNTTSAGLVARATPPPAAATNNQEEYTCGICFEDIVEAGKHFGLLSCDHCFCLDCLRTWREAKDMEVEVTRACPACRVPSNYIVPSLTFCTGDEKNAVVDAYKRHLSMRECKYFDGTFGSCPFGFNCFYAHRNSAGEDIKHLDRPRRRRRRSDTSETSSGGGTSRGSARRRRGGGSNALSSILERYNDFFRFLESFEWEERVPPPRD